MFVVLPDHDGALAVRRPAPDSRTLATHESGRPLIVGVLGADALFVHRSRAGLVALLGFCPVSDEDLRSKLDQVSSYADLDRVTKRLPGSHYVIAALGDRIRVRGTLSNTRRVFYPRGTSDCVLSNRADVVAGMQTAALDETSIALRLMFPAVPHPLSNRTLWRGVEAVPPGHDAEFRATGGAVRTSQWWQPPESELGRAEASSLFREALCAAVDNRASAHVTMSCDLSGGMDSTPVAYLAWLKNPRLTAVTLCGLTTADDDTASALRAAERMPGVDHVLLEDANMPGALDGMFDAPECHDEPFVGVQSAKFLAIARLVAARGSTLHLSGHGGDEVLTAPTSYLHTLARRNPRVALNHLYGQRALRRWSLRDLWGVVGDRGSYGDWLSGCARDLAFPLSGPHPPPPTWNQRLRLPGWVTEEGRRVVADALSAAADAEPLARTRSQHQSLENIGLSGRVARLIGQAAGRGGVAVASPFLDDRVIECCLAVRPYERSSPWDFKPLLTESLRGIVPAELMQRSTKNDMSENVHAGFRKRRRQITELCQDSVLAQLGLVDANALRLACTSPQPPGAALPAMITTLNCETWLRGVTSSSPSPGAEPTKATAESKGVR
ncbi:asparagine synthase-related protein [Amycolatopsis sp. Poz14]|uniref:asparagine synthase-related protein n=1 Tax=Amycolatopsis sp. Poz14 TaxID=1447705 RepID=UPI001EE8A32A|nr:asparagine synthase-related protein [Amycolatopsis sp. Poz14]MCG3754333.1 asparagine synthase [Amycolatopsis sp. Poz14]